MPKTLRIREIDLRIEGASLRSIPVSSLTVAGENRHDLLENRNISDQHIIESVTNLRNELDIRVQGAPDGEETRIPLWEAQDKITNSIINQVNGNIGIDVDSPGYKVDIAGLVRLAGVIFGQLTNGPYMTESSGDLNLSNPSYRTHVGARVLHLEGQNEVAITAWQDSITFELTDRNTANTFSIVMVILQDGFYFLAGGNLIAVLDDSGKLWLKDVAIGPLSSYNSSAWNSYFQRMKANG